MYHRRKNRAFSSITDHGPARQMAPKCRNRCRDPGLVQARGVLGLGAAAAVRRWGTPRCHRQATISARTLPARAVAGRAALAYTAGAGRPTRARQSVGALVRAAGERTLGAQPGTRAHGCLLPAVPDRPLCARAGRSSVQVLRACGARVVVPRDQHCCGLPAPDAWPRPRSARWRRSRRIKW